MMQYVVSFSLFVVLQSLAINGVKICFQEGMIFYKFGEWLKVNVNNKELLRPIFTCIICMSSAWSAITFFTVVLPIYGFKWIELVIWVWDAFILCALNGYIYKKI